MKKRTMEKIRKIKANLNLPGEAKFIGYCVYNSLKDEFLHQFEDNEDVTLKAWTIMPEFSLTFDDQNEAKLIASSFNNGSIGAYLFETDSQILMYVE